MSVDDMDQEEAFIPLVDGRREQWVKVSFRAESRDTTQHGPMPPREG